MTCSQKRATEVSGDCRSMKTPKFQSAIADTKYVKTRFSRAPGLRTMQIPARETFSRSATRGRSLCRITGIPLGTVEGEEDLVLLALLFDFFSQDAEHEHIPVLAILESCL